jgi:hypothetical protein
MKPILCVLKTSSGIEGFAAVRAPSWDRAQASYWPTAKQQGEEFVSTDPTTGTQDARVQERRFSAKISLLSRRRQ